MVQRELATTYAEAVHLCSLLYEYFAVLANVQRQGIQLPDIDQVVGIAVLRQEKRF